MGGLVSVLFFFQNIAFQNVMAGAIVKCNTDNYMLALFEVNGAAFLISMTGCGIIAICCGKTGGEGDGGGMDSAAVDGAGGEIGGADGMAADVMEAAALGADIKDPQD